MWTPSCQCLFPTKLAEQSSGAPPLSDGVSIVCSEHLINTSGRTEENTDGNTQKTEETAIARQQR
jgi:hypothetical protein